MCIVVHLQPYDNALHISAHSIVIPFMYHAALIIVYNIRRTKPGLLCGKLRSAVEQNRNIPNIRVTNLVRVLPINSLVFLPFHLQHHPFNLSPFILYIFHKYYGSGIIAPHSSIM